MKKTKNLGLNMPDEDDFVEIDKINENMEKIDEELANKADISGCDISETVITTTEESTAEYPVPAAGDSAKTVLGKVQKFFADIRNWMTGVCLLGQIVNNCVTDNAKLPLSAAQGKVLMDRYTVLNTNFEAAKKSSSDGKKLVANAITQRGVSTAADAVFSTMAANIKKLTYLQSYSTTVSTNGTFYCQTHRINFYKLVVTGFNFTPKWISIDPSTGGWEGSSICINNLMYILSYKYSKAYVLNSSEGGYSIAKGSVTLLVYSPGSYTVRLSGY